MAKKDLLVVICKTSGAQTDVTHDIKDSLADAEKTFVIKKVTSPPEVYALVDREQHKFGTVAIYGGDGSVTAAIKALAGNMHTRLMILPGGTANIIAAELGIPTDIKAMLSAFTSFKFKVERYDIAQAGENQLVFDLHTGWWRYSISHTPRKLKKRFGQIAYGITAIKNLPKLKKQRYAIEIDGTRSTHNAYLMMLANHGHQNFLGLPIFPRKHQRGRLQVVFLNSINPILLVLWVVKRSLRPRSSSARPFRTMAGYTITVIKAPKLSMYDDQEEKLNTPLTVKAGVYDIPVIVPATPLSLIAVVASRFRYWGAKYTERLRKFITGVPSKKYSRVAPGLYVGGSYRKQAYKVFKQWGVGAVVNMRMNTPPRAPKGFDILQLRTRDWHAPSLESFEQGVSYIARQRKQGNGVYIHCRQGEGRGPTMAAAYLVSEGFELEDVLTYIRSGRPMARPNKRQVKALAEWQEHCRSKA